MINKRTEYYYLLTSVFITDIYLYLFNFDMSILYWISSTITFFIYMYVITTVKLSNIIKDNKASPVSRVFEISQRVLSYVQLKRFGCCAKNRTYTFDE